MNKTVTCKDPNCENYGVEYTQEAIRVGTFYAFPYTLMCPSMHDAEIIAINGEYFE